MTTPDPNARSGASPDDATSAFDSAAFEPAVYDSAASAGAAAPPWPDPASAPWPPADPAGAAAPAGAPGPPPPFPASGAQPMGTIPPTGTVPPSGSLPPYGGMPPAGSVPPAWGWPDNRPPTATRARTTPAGLVGGVILVVVGAALLVSRVVDISYGGVTWPLWIVVPGVAMLVGSFFIPPRGGLGLAIPGAMITIVGLILWVQDVYGLYATWAYAWALVAPAGAGLGMLLYGLVHRDGELVGDGLRTTLVGVGLFLGFALFFEGVLGLSGDPFPNLDQVLPYAVIGLGVLLVVLSLFGGGRRDRRRA